MQRLQMICKCRDENQRAWVSYAVFVWQFGLVGCKPSKRILFPLHRPYAGEFVADDPQRRLDLVKPKLPNGECPPNFLGFAVNMINVVNANLFCVTASGHGLRETLFYNLFSRLQVYRKRQEMVTALPCISDGAISLDGGMIKSTSVFP